jgi:Rrf2 family nitric oxide-sensitive transcriptional repressor
MQLSLHADYACRTLIYLALLEGDVRVSIEDVATAYGISENHLVKVVHALGKLGYVDTLRGRGGGIRLARPAAEITVGEIVRALEPHFILVECFAPETNTCTIISSCGLKSVLNEALQAYLAKLDQYTIADVLRAPHGLKRSLGLLDKRPAPAAKKR